MVQSAEDWLRSALAEPLDRPMARRILGQGQMRARFVVMDGVGRKDLPRVTPRGAGLLCCCRVKKQAADNRARAAEGQRRGLHGRKQRLFARKENA